MELTKEEIKKSINENLDRLAVSTFNDDYHVDLFNLAVNIELLLDRVRENVEVLEGKYSGFKNDVHNEAILESCDCAGTLCRTLKQKINPTDFATINDLQFLYRKLNEN